MRIFFYAGKCIPIHAGSLEERPLGGTETGLIRVAGILRKRGHDITVFTSHKNPPPSDPPYLPADKIAECGECDVLVSIQDWWASFFQIPAKKRFYWTGDCADQYMNFGLGDRRIVGRIDLFLAVSDWHAKHLCQQSGFPFQKTHVVKNGIHLPWFEGQEKRNRKKLIFTSSPYRGLQLCLPIFKLLKEKHPDTEFHSYAGMSVYDKDRPFEGPKQAQYEKIRAALEQETGCFVHGNIRQDELAREYMKSGIFFYPNLFPEASCITAMEAQAAGCPIVTSAYAALPETVGDSGLLVQGRPGSEEYNRAFAEAASRLLTDDELWQKLSKRGKERAASAYSWEHVADRFEGALRRVFPA